MHASGPIYKILCCVSLWMRIFEKILLLLVTCFPLTALPPSYSFFLVRNGIRYFTFVRVIGMRLNFLILSKEDIFRKAHGMRGTVYFAYFRLRVTSVSGNLHVSGNRHGREGTVAAVCFTNETRTKRINAWNRYTATR